MICPHPTPSHPSPPHQKSQVQICLHPRGGGGGGLWSPPPSPKSGCQPSLRPSLPVMAIPNPCANAHACSLLGKARDWLAGWLAACLARGGWMDVWIEARICCGRRASPVSASWLPGGLVRQRQTDRQAGRALHGGGWETGRFLASPDYLAS
ncbi:hypothetical protein BS50DRAFT_198049 [Corynespora cassiicola Philippines]|uniref:Uncharacterized protein n=1 Tax=Corynespora cassiicola Philippines TaxID=1448308 RepID=A0A2T2N5S9_CORCC|nr:hypothetical protein BS50DRAFT_198049 [Corynespora cassiicola Philippines]